MAPRQYKYNAKDELVAIHLRQQTRLGNGLVVEADKLRKPGATAFAFAAPRLVAAAGVTCAARNDAPGPATTAAAAHAGANAEGAAPSAARTQPIARSNMGQELHEQKIAKGRLSRDAKQVQRLAAEQAARMARCRQSRGVWCCTDAKGLATCTFVCESIKELERHLEGGKHTEGLIRPPSHRAGVVAGRSTAHDRDVALARKHVEAVAATSLRTASLQPAQLQPADAFTIVFADGRACELTPVVVIVS